MIILIPILLIFQIAIHFLLHSLIDFIKTYDSSIKLRGIIGTTYKKVEIVRKCNLICILITGIMFGYEINIWL